MALARDRVSLLTFIDVDVAQRRLQIAVPHRWFEEPYRGWWTIDGYPSAITVDGQLFHKARYRQPYDGVIEQYREAVPRNSKHLFVRADGSWFIDHTDDDNPDIRG